MTSCAIRFRLIQVGPLASASKLGPQRRWPAGVESYMKSKNKRLNPPVKSKSAWEEYLFFAHSESFLIKWAKELKYFRFFRAYGGHANDFDEIILALNYAGENDLIALFDNLGIIYRKYAIKPPQPEMGKNYSGVDFADFPSLIPGTSWIEQPGWQTIDSVRVFLWCTENKMKIAISGPEERNWQITEEEFANAARLEVVFAKYAQQMIDPPIDSKNCICPKYYPHYWITG